MDNVKIRINVKNFGSMEAELYPDYAPNTVANFVKLAQSGFYEGLIFHRIIRGFMIQGGGMKPTFEQKECKSIKGEFRANGFAQNTLKHTRGVLSMARTMIPDSASSQFFIMHEDAPHLDGQYAAFGCVTEGIEVVDKIANVRTDFRDCPLAPVVIKSVSIID